MDIFGEAEFMKDRYYRDLKNSIDTAREEGESIGEERGVAKVAINMIKSGECDEKISNYTGLSLDDVMTLRQKVTGNS